MAKPVIYSPDLGNNYIYFDNGQQMPTTVKNNKVYIDGDWYNLDNFEIRDLSDMTQDIVNLDISSLTNNTPFVSTGNQYTVKKGDSLWKISKQQGVPFNTLKSLNPQITNPNRIYVGDVINLSNSPQLGSLKDIRIETELPEFTRKNYYPESLEQTKLDEEVRTDRFEKKITDFEGYSRMAFGDRYNEVMGNKSKREAWRKQFEAQREMFKNEPFSEYVKFRKSGLKNADYFRWYPERRVNNPKPRELNTDLFLNKYK